MSINPNATQHNIPAWTISFMFLVISLGNIVREKEAEVLRIKTLPVSITHLLIAKQVVFFNGDRSTDICFVFNWCLLFPILQLPPLIISSGFLLLFWLHLDLWVMR